MARALPHVCLFHCPQCTPPLETPEVSPGSSPTSTPPDDPQVMAINSMQMAMATQATLMQQVADKLAKLQEKSEAEQEAKLEAEAIRMARISAQQEESQQRQHKNWSEMRARLENFEKVLRAPWGRGRGPSLPSRRRSKTKRKTSWKRKRERQRRRGDEEVERACSPKRVAIC